MLCLCVTISAQASMQRRARTWRHAALRVAVVEAVVDVVPGEERVDGRVDKIAHGKGVAVVAGHLWPVDVLYPRDLFGCAGSKRHKYRCARRGGDGKSRGPALGPWRRLGLGCNFPRTRPPSKGIMAVSSVTIRASGSENTSGAIKRLGRMTMGGPADSSSSLPKQPLWRGRWR